MGELLDLIIDFEKGLLQLLKDIIINPKAVADKIITKEKKYIAPYKFYTLALSLWIISYPIIEGGGTSEFYLNNVPLVFRDYEDSLGNFVKLALPFIILIEYFVPIVIINTLIFKGQSFSFVKHLLLNVYLAGFYLLWILVVAFLSIFLDDLMSEIIGYLLLLGVPIIHYGYFHVKIFSNKKVLSFSKAVLSFGLILVLNFMYILESPVHGFLYKKIYSYNFTKIDLVPVHKDFYHYEDLSKKRDEYYFTNAKKTKGQTGHLFRTEQWSSTTFSMHTRGFMYEDKNDTLDFAIPKQETTQPTTHLVSQYNASKILVTSYTKDIGNAITDYDVETKESRIYKLKNATFLQLQSGFEFSGKMFFTGYNEKDNLPLIGRFNEQLDSVIASNLKLPHYKIADIDIVSDSSVAALCYSMVNKKLQEIQLITFNVDKNYELTKTSELPLYKNQYNPTAGANSLLTVKCFNNEILTTYQLMTDSTYVTHITSYNLSRQEINWENTYKVSADLAIAGDVLYDEKYIYLLGRAASVFRKGLSLYDYSLPFLKVIDKRNGNELGTYFLQQDNNTLDDVQSLGRPTSSYSDDEYVYFCINARHYYQISKEKLDKIITKK